MFNNKKWVQQNSINSYPIHSEEENAHLLLSNALGLQNFVCNLLFLDLQFLLLVNDKRNNQECPNDALSNSSSAKASSVWARHSFEALRHLGQLARTSRFDLGMEIYEWTSEIKFANPFQWNSGVPAFGDWAFLLAVMQNVLATWRFNHFGFVGLGVVAEPTAISQALRHFSLIEYKIWKTLIFIVFDKEKY